MANRKDREMKNISKREGNDKEKIGKRQGK